MQTKCNMSQWYPVRKTTVRYFLLISSVFLFCFVLCKIILGLCKSGLYQVNQWCYRFDGRNKADWSTAKSYCEGIGGKLAEIETAEEQAAINQYLLTGKYNMQIKVFLIG